MKFSILILLMAGVSLGAVAQEDEESIRAPIRRTPEQILGSAANVSLVAQATRIFVESVSVSPKITVVGWTNGELKTEETKYLIWDRRSPLKTERGPLPVSDAMSAKLRKLLTSPYTFQDDGVRLACGYLPCYRFRFVHESKSLDVLVIKCYNTLAVFQDGEQVGGRHSSRETHGLVAELNALFAEVSPSPIQAAETTRGK